MTGVFVFGLAILLIVVATVWWSWSSSGCSTTLRRLPSGELRLEPDGRTFTDLNAFQQWWAESGNLTACPVPVLEGERERIVLGGPENEQTYAKTPINKVDDYEFSRVFGYERDGRMVVPRQNFNLLLNGRTFDWADRPLSSDERRAKYAGLREGFTAAGDLQSVEIDDAAREAVARYGERRSDGDPDLECRMSRESREVAAMVARAYRNDAAWEPVVTRVGPHHWEVNELKPRRRAEVGVPEVEERVVDTSVAPEVDVQFQYPGDVSQSAIDPYFGTGQLPFDSERRSDPFYGPVPGMERMFGPTFDRTQWY